MHGKLMSERMRSPGSSRLRKPESEVMIEPVDLPPYTLEIKVSATRYEGNQKFNGVVTLIIRVHKSRVMWF